MQDASNSNSLGDVANAGTIDQRQQVVQMRTQAFAILLLAMVALTLTATFARRNSVSGHPQPNNFVIDLNAATTAELNLLPGVGEKLAEQIIEYRAERGGFASVDELTNIRGIKEARLSALRKHLVVREPLLR